MNYILIALFSYAVLAVVNILDKYLVTGFFNKPIPYAVFVTAMEAPILLVIPFNGLIVPKLPIMLLCFSIGALFFAAVIPYCKAMSLEEPSRVTTLYQLVPLFVIVISVLFRQELLNTKSIFGFFFLLAGGIIISMRRINGVFSWSKATLFALWGSLMVACIYVIEKYILRFMPVLDALVWMRLGGLGIVLCVLAVPKYRKDTFSLWKSLPKKDIGIFLSSETLTLFGVSINSFAVAAGAASIVSVLSSFQSVFVLIMAIFISIWFPKILKEELTSSTIALKIISIILITIGLWMVY